MAYTNHKLLMSIMTGAPAESVAALLAESVAGSYAASKPIHAHLLTQ